MPQPLDHKIKHVLTNETKVINGKPVYRIRSVEELQTMNPAGLGIFMLGGGFQMSFPFMLWYLRDSQTTVNEKAAPLEKSTCLPGQRTFLTEGLKSISHKDLVKNAKGTFEYPLCDDGCGADCLTKILNQSKLH